MNALWRLIRGYFVFVGMLVTGIFLVLFALLPSSKQSRTFHLSKDASIILEVPLRGQVAVKDTDKNLWHQALQEYLGKSSELYIPDLRMSLRQAKKDPRVKALFLSVEGLSGSLADFSEIKSLILDFKESGKPVHGWFTSIDGSDLLLSSVCDKISMPPLGSIFATSPTSTMVYFGDALKKIGVTMEVVRLGKFKSLGEPFTQNEPSEENKEAREALNASMQEELVQQIGKNKDVPLETVKNWLKKGLYTTSKALEAGIIDDIAYEDEAKKHLASQLDGEFLKLSKYDRTTDLSYESMGSDGIGLIEAVGEFSSSYEEMATDGIAYRPTVKELNWAMEHKDVKAVLIRINSPGGSAFAADMIWQKVSQLAAKKPVVVSIAGVAASGGYYIAAPATKIFADPMSITGSIGAVALLPRLTGIGDKFGIHFNVIADHDRLALLNPSKSLSQADRALLEENLSNTYNTFLDRVSKGRKMPLDQLEKIAQGRVWSGSQALKLGLVDQMGGFHEAIAAAKELAGLDPHKDYPLLRYTPPIKSMSDCLLNASSFSDCFSISTKASFSLLSLSKWIRNLSKDPVQLLWMDGMMIGQTIEINAM